MCARRCRRFRELPLPDQVFRRLVGDVLSGRYAPGERLPAQRTLAAELGVNMASVREGVKRLEQLRLVETRHGDGMRVRDWRAHGGLDVLVHAVADGGGAGRRARARGVRGAPRCCSPRRPRSPRAAAPRSRPRCSPGSRARSPPRGTTRRPGPRPRVHGDGDRGGRQPRVLAHRQLDPRRLPPAARPLPRRSSPAARAGLRRRRPASPPATPRPPATAMTTLPARRRPGSWRRSRDRGVPRPAFAVITPREASIVAALADAAAAPEPPLPPVAATDAAAAFDAWLAAGPRRNRIALRDRAARARARERAAALPGARPGGAVARAASASSARACRSCRSWPRRCAPRRWSATTATRASWRCWATTPRRACARSAPAAPRDGHSGRASQPRDGGGAPRRDAAQSESARLAPERLAERREPARRRGRPPERSTARP